MATSTTDGRRLAGAETRARLIAAATQILATRGEAGLTLRAVSDAAAANVAADKYHFGSREALIVAVVDAATRPVIDAQVAALQALEEREQTPSAAEWVEAWSRPLIRVAIARSEDERRLGRIVGQTLAAPFESLDVQVREAASEPSTRLLRGLGQALPDQDNAERRLRLAIMASALAGLASGAFEPFLGSTNRRRDLEARIVARMIAIAAT